MVHHNSPVSASEICLENGKTKSNTFQLDVLEKVHVKDACYVQLPAARLYSISQIESDAKIEVYRWAVDFKKLIKGLDPVAINDLVKSFQESNNAMPPLDPYLAKALHRDLIAAAKPAFSEWPIQTALGIAGAALLIGGVLVVTVGGAGLYKRKRARIAAREAAAHDQQMRMDFLDNAMRDPLIYNVNDARQRRADAMPNAVPRRDP